MTSGSSSVTLQLDNREIKVSNPGKMFFPQRGFTKLDLIQYYLQVSSGALRAIRERPIVLKRYPNGVEGEFFYQKRAPAIRPPWVETVLIRFPSGRSAEEVVVNNAATLAWALNLGCIDLHPHPVRRADLDHPDELRVDLDPSPDSSWPEVRQVALVVREVLADHQLRGYPKTSGSRGMHISVRLLPHWGFPEVRRAALALAREVERRAPSIATSKWWKEERHGVFIDYNQNAKDRTVASAYSVRPTPDARVSTPLSWEEVPGAEPGDFTLATVPQRFSSVGDPAQPLDDISHSLQPLLELSERQESTGLGDAPWPPHFQKQEGEPPRVQPSRRKKS